MAKNLKKFMNPKFIRTVALEPMRRLFERHLDALVGFDMSVFDSDDATARAELQAFLAGTEENYPAGLVADLHRIAELGTAEGLRLLLEEAGRRDMSLLPDMGRDGSEAQQDPKHVALTVFLDRPDLFDATSDRRALMAYKSLAEFAGAEEYIEPRRDAGAREDFQRAVSAIFEADLLGRYCRVGWYDDDDAINLVVTHGSTVTTTTVVDGGAETIISYRAAKHAVLSYSAADGRLTIGGVAKARHSELAEIFAVAVMGRPGFFATPDAQHLYTLAPIERSGPDFRLRHPFPQILFVQIIEAKAHRVAADPRTRSERPCGSILVRDYRESALVRLFETCGDLDFRKRGWRLSHIVIRVHIRQDDRRPVCVEAKIKPPSQVIFNRDRFEFQIMELLRLNGLWHDRYADGPAIAAE